MLSVTHGVTDNTGHFPEGHTDFPMVTRIGHTGIFSSWMVTRIGHTGIFSGWMVTRIGHTGIFARMVTWIGHTEIHRSRDIWSRLA